MILSVESSKPDLDTLFVKTEEQVAEKARERKTIRQIFAWVGQRQSVNEAMVSEDNEKRRSVRYSDTADFTCPRANSTFVVMDLATHNSFVG